MNSEQLAVFEVVSGGVKPGLEETAAYVASCSTEAWSRGQHLVNAGEQAPDVFFLHRGLTQLYQVDRSGRVYTKTFHREGMFTGAHAAAATKTPATFSVRALEDVVATRVSFAALDALARREPRLQLFLRRTAERLFWRKEQREMALLAQSATTRFENALREAPWLESRVLQKDLATYLGITEVSLSRLRARLSRRL